MTRWLESLDRRWIFVAMGLLVLLPLLFPILGESSSQFPQGDQMFKMTVETASEIARAGGKSALCALSEMLPNVQQPTMP